MHCFLSAAGLKAVWRPSPRAAIRDFQDWYKLGPLETGSYIIPPLWAQVQCYFFFWNFFSCVPDTTGVDFLGRYSSIYFCRWMGFLNVCWSTFDDSRTACEAVTDLNQDCIWWHLFHSGILKLRGERSLGQGYRAAEPQSRIFTSPYSTFSFLFPRQF